MTFYYGIFICAYNIFWLYSYLFPSYWSHFLFPTNPFSTFTSIVVIQWVSLGLLTGAWASYQWLYYWRKFFLTLEVISYYRSSEKGGVLLVPPSSLAGCWQIQPCVGKAQATRAFEFKSAKAMVMPEDYSPTLPLP